MRALLQRVKKASVGIDGKINGEIGGQVLVVSQFTLGADVSHGRRPSFIAAAKPPVAIPLYEGFVKECAAITKKDVPTGEFGADMQVSLINDGPVTIWLDTDGMKVPKT